MRLFWQRTINVSVSSAADPHTPAGHASGRRQLTAWRRGCVEQGWGFQMLGILLISTAFLEGALYASIRSATSSLQHIEAIPSYANAVLICVCGIFNMVMYKRQDAKVVIPSLAFGVVCILLSLSSAVLTGVHVIATMLKFERCTMDQGTSQCRCYVVVDSPLGGHEIEYTFENTPSCHTIQNTVFMFVCVQCACDVFAVVTDTISMGVAAWVLYLGHAHKYHQYTREEDEEEYGGSVPQQSSPNAPMTVRLSHAMALPDRTTPSSDQPTSDQDTSGEVFQIRRYMYGSRINGSPRAGDRRSNSRQALAEAHELDDITIEFPVPDYDDDDVDNGMYGGLQQGYAILGRPPDRRRSRRNNRSRETPLIDLEYYHCNAIRNRPMRPPRRMPTRPSLSSRLEAHSLATVYEDLRRSRRALMGNSAGGHSIACHCPTCHGRMNARLPWYMTNRYVIPQEPQELEEPPPYDLLPDVTETTSGQLPGDAGRGNGGPPSAQVVDALNTQDFTLTPITTPSTH